MVCDLDVLEAALAELTSRVEDRNLEKIRPAGAGAVTVEVFARWVHDSLSPVVAAAGGGALAVRVRETPGFGISGIDGGEAEPVGGDDEVDAMMGGFGGADPVLGGDYEDSSVSAEPAPVAEDDG
jgi:hypothetical protein